MVVTKENHYAYRVIANRTRILRSSVDLITLAVERDLDEIRQLDQLCFPPALRCFQWVTQREVMYAGSGWVRVGSWSLAAMR
jgi:hypothetical protein